MQRFPSRRRPSEKYLRTGASVAAIIAALAVPAKAQTASETVTVTGSRIIGDALSSPTPVTVVSTADLAVTTPSDVPDALNKLPVFAESRSQTTTGGSTINWPGNFLNLRDFGSARVLILLDGNRVPYTDQSGDVDTNTLPQTLMSRVDVETGGASAVYGSDAITGVVNFILNHKFDGFKVEANAGISGYGDDASWKASVTAGSDLFGGRGHIEASYSHYSSDGIDSIMARPYGSLIPQVIGTGSASNPYVLQYNVRNTNYTMGGYINNAGGALYNMQFASNNVLTPFHHGLPGSGPNEIGGDGGYFGEAEVTGTSNAQSASSLVASLRSNQFFARFDYDVSDDFHAYAQASSAQSSNWALSGTQNFSTKTFTADNAYLPAAATAALAAAGQNSFTMSKMISNEIGAVSAGYTNVDDFTIGATGTIFSKFNWDTHLTYGDSQLHEKSPQTINNQRFDAALDAVKAPDGSVVCRVSLTSSASLYPGCTPYNAFGPTANSPAAWTYVTDLLQWKADNTMADFGASVNGPLFDEWAGPVKAAVDVEYRDFSLVNYSNQQPTQLVNCTGLNTFVAATCNPTQAIWNGATAYMPLVSENVGEVAVESDIPLVKDVPFIQTFGFNLAARYTHYQVSGASTTWKVGAVWDVSDEFSVRGTVSRDIHAPTLSALFGPANANLSAFTDFLTGVSNNTVLSRQGNPNLKPEVARTNTVGLIYKPSWLPDFSLSADYYQISIHNVISSISGGSTTSEQICIASGGTSAFCSLVIRPHPITDTSPDNYPSEVLSASLNAGITTTHGVDGEMNYGLDLSDIDSSLPGRFDTRMLLEYQPAIISISSTPGAPITNAAGQGNANGAAVSKTRVTWNLGYTDGPIAVNGQVRWHSSQSNNQDKPQTLIFTYPGLPAYYLVDLTVSYQFKMADSDPGANSIYLSVQNLLNRAPYLYQATGRTGAEGYNYPANQDEDTIGRYFTVGLRYMW